MVLQDSLLHPKDIMLGDASISMDTATTKDARTFSLFSPLCFHNPLKHYPILCSSSQLTWPISICNLFSSTPPDPFLLKIPSLCFFIQTQSHGDILNFPSLPYLHCLHVQIFLFSAMNFRFLPIAKVFIHSLKIPYAFCVILWLPPIQPMLLLKKK